MRISKIKAKAFLLYKQLLLHPRQLEGQGGIETVFRRLRSIQYDPQNPCGRNVDILLQARVKGIQPSDYYHWLYDLRNGIETYDRELCVIPIEDLALCRKIHPASRQRRTNEFMRKNKSRLESLLRFISENGAVSSIEVNKLFSFEKTSGALSWSRVALDCLWRKGMLVICRRNNGQKIYDLPIKVYEDHFLWTDSKGGPTEDQVIRRIGCVGILPKSGTGGGWLGIGTGKEILPVVERLLSRRKLVEVTIANISRPFVALASDESVISGVTAVYEPKMVSFLPPLDNLLWDRRMIAEVFDFDYKWEAYLPRQKRQYGHYVLPILYGDKFIGRIEPKLVGGNRLQIRGLWKEIQVQWTKSTVKAFWRYMEEFVRYLNVNRVEWLEGVGIERL